MSRNLSTVSTLWIKLSCTFNRYRFNFHLYIFFILKGGGMSLLKVFSRAKEIYLSVYIDTLGLHSITDKHAITAWLACNYRTHNWNLSLHLRFIRSLSRCKVWDAKGGKSGSAFCKTHGKLYIPLFRLIQWCDVPGRLLVHLYTELRTWYNNMSV